jgi:hypothetical protein
MFGLSIAFTPSATIRRASMSRPESVSSRIAISGSRTAIWSISRRFFSPPEKPSFTYREANDSSIRRTAIFSRTFLRNSPIGMPPRMASVGSTFGSGVKPARRALIADRRKLATDRPGIAIGYWKARNRPRRARLSAESLSRLWPCQSTSPELTT